MRLLAIETSCDETSAAVVDDGRIVRSNVIASQEAVHAAYGGVVPEIASRKHVEVITPVVEEALSKADTSLDEIEGVAVTQGPGLAGSLLVGISMAKSIAYARNLPLVGVHHIEGHMFAVQLEKLVPFPFLALVVSGGHTHLYRVGGFGRYDILGQTRDDAAGEAFDKVAKIIGLPYPGGSIVDRLAADGDPHAVKLPRPLMHDGSCNFSFSGLKTAVLQYVRNNLHAAEGTALNDLCASFQAAVCHVLAEKTRLAIRNSGVTRLVVAGGVACNSGLRKSMTDVACEEGIELAIPSPVLCTDNGAMIAVPAYHYLKSGIRSSLDLDARTVWPLDRIDRGMFG
jgi:N6-L-threonylcarbamoyladenine synthase